MIGLVNTPEGQRVKLIRFDSIGSYSWDSSSESINSGYGVNEWSQSKLKTLLNEIYYNHKNGTCYNDLNEGNIPCDFSVTGIQEEAKVMLDEVTWNYGSNGDQDFKVIDTINFYRLERSNHTGKICTSGTYCNDEISRTFSWKGYVGLISPSDYGYASSGGVNLNRENCLTTSLFAMDIVENQDCKTNNWLHKNTHQWLMVPISYSTSANSVFRILNTGSISSYSTNFVNNIFPSVYLNVNLKVLSGNGSMDSPFQFIM